MSTDPPSEVADRGLCQTGSVGGMGGNKAETAVRSHENIFFFFSLGRLAPTVFIQRPGGRRVA